MNRTRVRATTGGLALLFAAAVAGFAWRARSGGEARPAPEASGAALFETHCAGCHAAADLAGRVRTAPDPAARLREFAALLDAHGEASVDEDRRILAFLVPGVPGIGTRR